MGRKKISNELDVVWPIRMKEGFKYKYKEYCDKHGFSMNKRVKTLMEKDLNGEIQK